MKTYIIHLAGFAIAFGLSTPSAMAHDYQNMGNQYSSDRQSGYQQEMTTHGVEVMREGNISYITGGIGEREEQAIRSAKKDYRLRVVNAGPKGAFIGDADIVISDRSGNELLNAEGGPLFYANLPNGKYRIDVSVNGRTQNKTFTIASGKPADVRFIWDTAQN